MYELKEGSCFPEVLVGVNVGLACVDGIIAVLAVTQVVLLSRSIILFYFYLASFS
jgi:hypothetical protein